MLEEVIHEPFERAGQKLDSILRLEPIQILCASTHECLHTPQEIDFVQTCLGSQVALILCGRCLAQNAGNLGLIHVLDILTALEAVGADDHVAVTEVFVQNVATFVGKLASPLEATNGSQDAVDEVEGAEERWLSIG